MTRMIYCRKPSWLSRSFIRIAGMVDGNASNGIIPAFFISQGAVIPASMHSLHASGNIFNADAIDNAADPKDEKEGIDDDPVKILQYVMDEIESLVKLLRGADYSYESQLLQSAMTKIIGRITEVQAAMAPIVNMQPVQPVNCEHEEGLLNHLRAVILRHLGDTQLDIGRLSDLMNMSRRNLFRRIKLSTGLSPGELINEIRLRTARELLLNSDLKMYEIAEKVGFGSRIVFTRNFTRLYGLSPTEFIKKHRASC